MIFHVVALPVQAVTMTCLPVQALGTALAVVTLDESMVQLRGRFHMMSVCVCRVPRKQRPVHEYTSSNRVHEGVTAPECEEDRLKMRKINGAWSQAYILIK